MEAALKIHPACAASPSMTASQYEALKADIATHGLVTPIVLHKGKILDGRHRYQICKELKIEPEFIRNDDLLEHKGDPWAYVWSSMQHKQLTEAQLGFFAVAREDAIKPLAKERQKRKPKSVPDTCPEQKPDSRDIAGKEFGISGRTVSRVRQVKEKGCEQLQQAVRDGRVNANLACQIARALDVDSQREAVAVAMVADKPEKALRDILPKQKANRTFDRSREADAIADWLRKRLDCWPAGDLPLALGVIHSILQEYKK